MTPYKHLALASLLGSSLALAGAAVAQAPEMPPGGDASHSLPGEQVDEERLRRFAEAQAEVIEISEKWTSRLDAADSVEAAREVQAEANQELVGAVQAAGFSVQEYNQISNTVQNDPALQSRVESLRP